MMRRRRLLPFHHHLPTSILHFSTSAPFYLCATPTALNKMDIELSAPNGKKWTQPLGLFVNNEFIKSSNDQKLASINPA